MDHHAAGFEPGGTQRVPDAVTHAGVTDAVKMEAAMPCAEAPFHVDVVDEEALVHASDLLECPQRQQAARRYQEVAGDSRARRTVQLAIERKADLDERRHMAVSTVAELRADGCDGLRSAEFLAGGPECRHHVRIEQAVLIEEQQIAEPGVFRMLGRTVHGGAESDVRGRPNDRDALRLRARQKLVERIGLLSAAGVVEQKEIADLGKHAVEHLAQHAEVRLVGDDDRADIRAAKWVRRDHLRRSSRSLIAERGPFEKRE